MLKLTLGELALAEEIGLLQERSSLTYDDLFRRSDPKRTFRSATVRGPPLEIDAYKDAVFHTFNFKSFPSTTGFRHRGYIKFEKPSTGRPMPSEKLPVVVDCTCPDFRYRWAWANKQRGASRVGDQSLNQAHNRAPRITNPGNKVGLCKHLLAARNYIYGLIQKFDKQDQPSQKGKHDIAWKLDQLTKYANKRWINYDADSAKAKARQKQQRDVQQARNIGGPMPAAEVPKNIDNESPVPLPPGMQPQISAKPTKPQQPQKLPPQIPKVAKPPLPKGKAQPPRGGQNQKREESIVVKTAAAKSIIGESMKNKELLKTKAIIDSMGNDKDPVADVEDVANAAVGAGPGSDSDFGDEAPPSDVPPGDELGAPDDLGPEAGSENPEDEALNLLRTISAGIERLADELAPIEAAPEEGMEPEAEMPPEEGAEGEGEPGDETGEDDSGVPPVEDDDDFEENMPVATGA